MDVKIGDEVLVQSRWKKAIVTVINITPKGFIRTSDGGYYDNNGRVKTSDPWNGSTIYILTEDMKKELLEEKLINETLYILQNIKELSYEQAIKIREVLEQ